MRLPRAIPMLLLLASPTRVPAQVPQEPPAQEPVFDPYRAEKAIEIGQYYFKKGNYDAAIDRFQEAARYKPNFARPYLLMGKAYEKKGEKAEAVKAYRRYLEILPSAEDAGKVRERIAKLSREIARAAARRRSG